MASTDTVKAWAALEEKTALQAFEFSYPEPLAANEVDIEITHCGVCHSDCHRVDNDWKDNHFPCVPGHEIVGRIVAVGSAVEMHSEGDMVGVGPQSGSCQSPECAYCTSDREQLCSKRIFTYNTKFPNGFITKGGFAQRTRVQARFAIPIPDDLAPEYAAPLLCAGITVYSPLVNFVPTDSPQDIGIVGIGGLGHLGVQFAAKMGHNVTAISRTDSKHDEAREFGAAHCLASSDAAQMEAAKSSLDVLLCTVSAALDWSLYMSLVRVDGTIILVGIPDQALEIPQRALIARRIKLIGSFIGCPKEQREMLAFCGTTGVVPKIERLPMSACNEAIDRCRRSDVRFRFVLSADW